MEIISSTFRGSSSPGTSRGHAAWLAACFGRRVPSVEVGNHENTDFKKNTLSNLIAMASPKSDGLQPTRDDEKT